MKQFLFCTGILCLLIGTSCSKSVIYGTGNISSRNMQLPAFTAVALHSDIKAVVVYGDSVEVKATGYDNLLNLLDFKVDNGVLHLNFNTTYNSIRNGNLVAYIKMPLLSGADIQGSKNVELSGFTNGNQLAAQIHGSGNIHATNCRYQSALLEVHGNGHIEAQGLQAKQAIINIHGSGSVSIAVSDHLKAGIFAGGNIYYWGNPVVELSQHGNGRLIKK